MKKIFLWIGLILLSPILLFIILTIALYLPPVQNWAVDKVVEYASEKTGYGITVDRVDLVFPLDLGINGFCMVQPNDSLPQVNDTVADVRKLVVDVSLMPLLDGKVVINSFELNRVKVNTADFIASVRVRATLGKLSLSSRGIDLNRQIVDLNDTRLSDARISIELSDTVPPDTSASKTMWRIYVDSLNIYRTDITVRMPGDTMGIRAYLGHASARGGDINLGTEKYGINRFFWHDGALDYDNRFEPEVDGLDYNHISLTGINIGIDSLSYSAPDIGMNLLYCRMKEKSGLEISNLSGPVSLDSVRLNLPSLILRTPDSDIEAQVKMDLNALDSINPGKIYARLRASVGKQDIMMFCGGMPEQFVRRYPNRPLTVRGSVDGNMRRVDISGLEVSLPTAFNMSARGFAANPTDMKRVKAEVRLSAQTFDLGFVTCLLDPKVMADYHIPSGIKLDGDVKADGRRYSADVRVREGGGTVDLNGRFDASSMSYKASVGVKDINIHHFMPKDSLYNLTCDIDIEGHGTDLLAKGSHLKANGKVDAFRYGSMNFDRIRTDILIANGIGKVRLDSRNELLDGTIDVDALLDPNRVRATVSTDLSKADLYRLRVIDRPFTAAMCAHVDIASDLKQSHMVKGLFNDFTVRDARRTYRPADVVLDASTNRDTTWAKLYSGNLEMFFTASGGYESLMDEGKRLGDLITTQIDNKTIDQPAIQAMLPTMQIRLKSGNENSFAGFLKAKGVEFDDLFVDLSTSPAEGIEGNMHLYSLVADSMQIDTVSMTITQEDTNVRFYGQVRNNKKNPQFVFNSLFEGSVLERGAELSVKYYDASDRLGASLGARAEVCDSGITVRLFPDKPILGYKAFNLNKDNFVFLGRDKRIQAGIDLVADDGTGVKIYSDDNAGDMLQDITVSLNKFDLDKLTSVIPYAPRMSGLLNGDFHVMQDRNEKFTVISDMGVDKMTYEHCYIGDLNSEFSYMQKDENSHYVSANLILDGRDIGVLSGTYTHGDKGYLDATFDMSRFPLSMINGFIPDHIMGFEGYAEGSVAVRGELDKPQVDGEVYLDSTHVISVPYGVNLRANDKPVRIVGSNLLFENFALYSHNDSPLNINGNVNFANPDKIRLDMRMQARNYQIIDARQTRKSVAYGKAFVNFGAVLNGALSGLKMRGQLDVLGKTNMTYILKDSPLNTDDRLKDLVTFTDFRDTAEVKVNRPEPGGLDMLLMMNIESGARIFCALNADQSNYVNIEGGGELRMVYNPTDNLQLFGRYTINSGEMKYELPIIPLKTFTIRQGSYIEFTGDVMNPTLNLSATEQVKTLVAAETGNSRSVLFDCGVKVSKTLSNMGLEFTLDAPEDMTIKNELAAMSMEQRGKLAVTMLTTGMYLADGNTGGFSMNSALNSFLQSEINSITNSAMRTVDLSLGLDQSADAYGNTHTDYSFKFAKRFWNNRVNFVIGGKISGGGDSGPEEQDQTFIDNVSLEYRLDQTAMRYVRMFYNKSAYDMLEGRITEYGAGFMWRKKADRFWQLFNFRSDDNTTEKSLENDTVKVNEEKR